MAEASVELMHELLQKLHERMDRLEHGQGEIKHEIVAMRLQGMAVQTDINNIYGVTARMDQRLDTLRQTVQNASDRIATVLESTGSELQTISRQQAAAPPDQTVVVQHKVPRVMLDLIKGQFHLMQEWLRPVLDNSQLQGRELTQLNARIESLMKTYVELQAELESAGEQG